jgi:hypothetical protein
MKYISGFIVILLMAMVVACEDETKICDQTLLSDLGINFKKDTNNGFTIIDTIWPKVTVMALNKDTILKNVPRSSVFVPLNPQSDTSSFYLKLDSTKTPDTLTFVYDRKPNFVSPGCGFATFYTIDTVIATFHTISYLRVNNKEVNSTNDTHVSLYFKR